VREEVHVLRSYGMQQVPGRTEEGKKGILLPVPQDKRDEWRALIFVEWRAENRPEERKAIKARTWALAGQMDTFEKKKTELTGKLKTLEYGVIEEETIKKRLKWLEDRKYATRDYTPREVFNILFFEYMGLNEEDLPVLSEDNDVIVWSSKNPCPTLEACKELGLDTRKVCKEIYEKPVRFFVSRLNPKLGFMRSYDEIRPYSHHCKEWIFRIDSEK